MTHDKDGEIGWGVVCSVMVQGFIAVGAVVIHLQVLTEDIAFATRGAFFRKAAP